MIHEMHYNQYGLSINARYETSDASGTFKPTCHLIHPARQACPAFTKRDNSGMPSLHALSGATPDSAGPVTPLSPVPLLAVRLNPSIRLAIILGMAHFTAIGLLWPLTLPVSVRLAGSVILLASLILYLRHHVMLRSPRSVLGFEVSDDMVCLLQTKEGNIACLILGSTFVAPYLTVLELKPVESRLGNPKTGVAGWWREHRKYSPRSVVILPDAIDTEAFRQLRVLLRWKWKDPA